MTVVRLATSQERKPTRACETCRYFKPDNWQITSLNECSAVSQKAGWARENECGGGDMWEVRLPSVPLLIRFKRWLIG